MTGIYSNLGRSGGQEEGAPKHLDQMTVPSLRRGRLLVVDDEAALGETLRVLLSDEHDVEHLTSASAALERIASGEDYDAVLCDLTMPGMTGVDLYSEVRAARPGYEKRFILMSAGVFTAQVIEFLDTVENAVVDKPFDLDELRRLLQKSVQRRRP